MKSLVLQLINYSSSFWELIYKYICNHQNVQLKTRTIGPLTWIHLHEYLFTRNTFISVCSIIELYFWQFFQLYWIYSLVLTIFDALLNMFSFLVVYAVDLVCLYCLVSIVRGGEGATWIMTIHDSIITGSGTDIVSRTGSVLYQVFSETIHANMSQ